MALRTWDSLFNWPTFDLWEVAPHRGSAVAEHTSLANLGAVDVTETPTEYLIVADTPGMTSNDVKVEIKGNTLSFSGERKEEHREENKDTKFYRIERHQSSFNRSFRLPQNADATQIKASCQDGVLKITLPKRAPAETAGTRIDVASSH
jgi:HSP20 family protein